MADESNSKALRKMIAVLSRFRQFDHKMQVSAVLTLLEVALADSEDRDLHPKDVEQRVGLHTGTTSRNLWYWSEGTKEMTGAHKLINIKPSSEDRRRKHLSLSHKGKAFVNALVGDLNV